MTPDEFERVRRLYLIVAELEPVARAAYLDEHCAHDPMVRTEVEALLAQKGRGDWLVRAAAPVAELRSALEGMLGALESEPGPERIGGYTILGTLGCGGMGIVYLAEQRNPRRKVAVKVVHPGGMSAARLRRFRHEASILGQLAHPGIAQIYEAGVGDVELPNGMTARWPFLVMEFVEGEPLSGYVQARCPSLRSRLVLLAAICDAVQHAHQKGVVHRDLKPSNILVTGDGQAKILDFGVARLTNADVQTVTMQTEAGFLVGTLPYMSPEQVSGVPEEIDTRSDVYALGVIGYELLTGRLPYAVPEHSIAEAARIIREVPPTHLGSVDARLRGDLDTLVGKALEKDRERRYQSASELAADIRNFLAGHPIAARPPTTLYQMRMFARRNKTLVTGVLATVLALLFGAVGMSYQAARATREWNYARQAEQLADQRRALAERRAYAATIAAAQAALAANDVATSRERLAAAPPHLRHWEWRYLETRLDSSRATLAAHDDFVWAVAYDPGGAWLASASADGTAKLWNVARGRVLRTFSPADGTIRGLAISPDGRRLVTASYAGVLSVWNTATGELVLSLEGHAGPVHDVAFSPDGARIASAAVDGTARLWDARTGAPLATLHHPNWVQDVCFAPDSTRVATACRDNVARVWDVSSGTVAVEIPVLPSAAEWDFVHCWEVAFSPDGRLLAVAAHDGVITLCSAATGEPQRVLAGHTERVRSLAFSADGARLASGSDDCTIRVWDPATGVQLALLLGHERSVFGVVFSPDDAFLASASADHTVRIWDSRGVTGITRIVGHENRGIAAVDVAPDGRTIISAGYDAAIHVWDLESGQRITTLRGHAGPVRDVQFSPDGAQAVSASVDRTVRVWDVASGRDVVTLAGHADAVEAVTYLSARGRVASAAADGTLRIWDVTARTELARLEDLADAFTALAARPGGGQLAAGTDGGRVVLWDLQARQRRDADRRHEGRIWDVAYSPDGSCLVSASDDGSLKLWSADDGTLRATLRGHGQAVRAAAFSPDGLRIASVAHDRTLRLWDSFTHETVLSFRAHQDWPLTVRFTPDGTCLVSGGKLIRIWRASAPDPSDAGQ